MSKSNNQVQWLQDAVTLFHTANPGIYAGVRAENGLSLPLAPYVMRPIPIFIG
jgi:hypothetical protein